MMGWIDVAIPGVFGLLLLLVPRFFTTATGDDAADRKRVKWLRRIGVLLLFVAALYLLIKLTSHA